jgi:hypothetical protein
LRGDETHMSILSRGVAASLAARDSDDADVLGDLQLAEYQFDDLNRQIEARRMPFGTAEESEFAPLGAALASVRFRYFDGAQWQSAFNSLEAGRLPVAVEVAVWFEIGDDGSTVAPPTAAEATAQAFDEHAFAHRNDRERMPPPDRRRVTLLPYAAGGGSDARIAGTAGSALKSGGES